MLEGAISFGRRFDLWLDPAWWCDAWMVEAALFFLHLR